MLQVQNYKIVTDEVNQIVNDPNLTLSSKIRTLYSMEFPKGQIAKLVNRRYQHVRNVINQPLKKS